MSVHFIALLSHISLENLSSACVKGLEFVDMRFFLFVPLCDCKSAAPIPKFDAAHMT